MSAGDQESGHRVPLHRRPAATATTGHRRDEEAPRDSQSSSISSKSVGSPFPPTAFIYSTVAPSAGATASACTATRYSALRGAYVLLSSEATVGRSASCVRGREGGREVRRGRRRWEMPSGSG